MRLTYLFSTLPFILTAAAKPKEIDFVIDGASIKGAVGAAVEGDGFSFFIHGAGSFGEYYDFEDGIASRWAGSKRGYVGIYDSYFAFGPKVNATKLEVKDKVITNFNFWACKNTGDPYALSKDYEMVIVGDKTTPPFKECTPIQVKIEDEFSSS